MLISKRIKKKKRIIWKEKTKSWNSLLKLHTYQQGLKVNTTIKTILLPKSSQNNTIYLKILGKKNANITNIIQCF